MFASSIWKLPYESYEHKTSHYTHTDPNYQSEEVLLVEETFYLFDSIVFFSVSALVKAMIVLVRNMPHDTTSWIYGLKWKKGSWK